MKQVWTILSHEFIYRVSKRSFLLITILAPLFFAAIILLPGYINIEASQGHKKVAVIDNSHLFSFKSSDQITFTPVSAKNINDIAPKLKKQNFDAIIFIPKNWQKNIFIYQLNQKITLPEQLKPIISQQIKLLRLKQVGLTPQQIQQIYSPENIVTLQWAQKQNNSIYGILITMGVIGATLIYFFIFMYGGMAMRSVMEEKLNRVIELIVSSVRPFDLMLGKLIAIFLVALLQFSIWTAIIILTLKLSVPLAASAHSTKILEILGQISTALKSHGILLWLLYFLIYFIGGYIIYGAIFAAIGVAIDAATDTQQFVLPLTAPLIFTMVMIGALIQNPNGHLATWLSIIPLTSPIVMVIRTAFGPSAVPLWQIIISIILLIITSFLAVWAAGKIFRYGTLFYGKRPTYKDLWKWIKS